MVKAVETRIFRLHHDPQTSERIGYLTSQQRLAYNIAAGILNRTPARRSRKRGPSTLTSLVPPVRLGGSTFTIMGTIMGARDIVLRTKKPVPEEMDIRSFQLVEVRKNCRGANGALCKRRYALYLQVAVEYPDPPKAEAIESPEEILGIDAGVNRVQAGRRQHAARCRRTRGLHLGVRRPGPVRHRYQTRTLKDDLRVWSVLSVLLPSAD